MKRELRNRGIFCAIMYSPPFLPIPLVTLYVLFGIETLDYLIYVFLLFLASAGPLVMLVLFWTRAARGGALKGIVDFCNQSANPEEMLVRMEKVWDKGFATNFNFRVDNEYLIWADKLLSGVFPLKDVIVIQILTGFKSIAIVTGDGEKKFLRARGEDQQEIKKYLRKNFPDIIVGEDDPMLKLWLEGDATLLAFMDKGDIAGAKAYIRRCREERGV
jgi:hypothetical protein